MHVITGLNSGGGAEMMLLRLLSSPSWAGTQHRVVSLMDPGPMKKNFKHFGIPCTGLGMTRGRISASGSWRLRDLFASARPDIVQGWMYHANLIAGLAARFTRIQRVFWGVHHANLCPSLNKRSTLLIAKACAPLSKLIPNKTIFCSHAAARVHWGCGYSEKRSVVIPNGFETEQFCPSTQARTELRRELGVEDGAILIGLVARFDILKDHATFCRAAALLSRHTSVHFVLAGSDISSSNSELVSWLRAAGVERRTHLLGVRTDMPQLYAALDVVTLSSCGEAFPNVIGEAMSSGVPCVVTDVGDCAFIVGETGIVVPPKDPVRLAEGWLRLINEGRGQRQARGALARQRILDRFSMNIVAAQYRDLYEGSLR